MDHIYVFMVYCVYILRKSTGLSVTDLILSQHMMFINTDYVSDVSFACVGSSQFPVSDMELAGFKML